MNKEINPMLHKENIQAFQWILENSGKKPIIWAAWVLSRKLNDAISGRVFYADFGTPQGNQSL